MTVDYDKYGENNYPKAIVISLIILAAFVLLSFFLIIGRATPLEDVGTGGIIVNYGTSDVGIGSDYMSVEEPSQDPNANNTPPDKVVPNTDPNTEASAQTSDKDIVTQDNIDAPEIATSVKKPTNTVAKPTESKVTKPVVNPNALYKGKKNNATGLGDGEGAGPGNQGSVNGDPLAANYGEGGSGNGNAQLDLTSRRFMSPLRITDAGQQVGIIKVEIHVNKAGTVVLARGGVRGTTIANRALIKKCEEAVLGASLNRLESAPDEQIGVVTFSFKVK